MAIDSDLIEMLSSAAASVQSFASSDTGKGLIAVGKAAKEAKGAKVSKWAPNPHMVQNGLAEKTVTGKDSPACKKYFTMRMVKKFGGSLFSGAGSIASSTTGGVNVAGALRHGRAEVKTLAHLKKLKDQADLIKQSRFLSQLIGVIITMKVIKAANQGGALAADLLPVPGLGTVLGKVGEKVAKGQAAAVQWASIEIHWRAYQERKLAGAKGSGPAMRMVRELFNQAFFQFPWESGALGADRYIVEPSGWMVIQDKLNLI